MYYDVLFLWILLISGIELSGATSANSLGALELASSWIIGKVFTHIFFSRHTTYRKNNNLEKCAGMGLNGFHIK